MSAIPITSGLTGYHSPVGLFFLPFYRPISVHFPQILKFQKFFSNLPKLFRTFLYLEAEKATDKKFKIG